MFMKSFCDEETLIDGGLAIHASVQVNTSCEFARLPDLDGLRVY